jgi:hypothetical protein
MLFTEDQDMIQALATERCVCRKPKSAHNGDEVRLRQLVTRCCRPAERDGTWGHLCPMIDPS